MHAKACFSYPCFTPLMCVTCVAFEFEGLNLDLFIKEGCKCSEFDSDQSIAPT